MPSPLSFGGGLKNAIEPRSRLCRCDGFRRVFPLVEGLICGDAELFQRLASKAVGSVRPGGRRGLWCGQVQYVADGVGSKRVLKAKQRRPWKVALWAGFLGLIAFELGAELLRDDPRWWLVALHALVLAAIAMNLYVESRKPKAEMAPK